MLLYFIKCFIDLLILKYIYKRRGRMKNYFSLSIILFFCVLFFVSTDVKAEQLYDEEYLAQDYYSYIVNFLETEEKNTEIVKKRIEELKPRITELQNKDKELEREFIKKSDLIRRGEASDSEFEEKEMELLGKLKARERSFAEIKYYLESKIMLTFLTEYTFYYIKEVSDFLDEASSEQKSLSRFFNNKQVKNDTQ